MRNWVCKSGLALGVVLSTAPFSFAWNSTGHETVAQIAYDQMPPDVRAKIVAALKHHPRLQRDLESGMAPGENLDRAIFLRAATWPDMVRSRMNPLEPTEDHPRWHYVDYPYERDGVHGEPVQDQWDGKDDPANLLQAMQKMEKQLHDPASSPERIAIDLCWVEHLTGDIHQPLHAVSMYSKEFPQGDRGGNDDIIGNPGDMGGPNDMIRQAPTLNLHTLWDDIEGLTLDPKEIRAIADRCEQEHPYSELKDQAANQDVEAWAKESLALAQEKVYLNGTLPHTVRDPAAGGYPDEAPPLPAGYETDARAVADKRIALAGYRLAGKLEEISADWPAGK